MLAMVHPFHHVLQLAPQAPQASTAKEQGDPVGGRKISNIFG
jgi:hypothetical protein